MDIGYIGGGPSYCRVEEEEEAVCIWRQLQTVGFCDELLIHFFSLLPEVDVHV